ncbi:angiogenic factor with G patch and FHA domains 1 isoform X2 [Pseudomyrmex gracilis]|uniref:angiogenic factor with G patch and FHA domains 1 isoform X2 n=1 Tax=Pseudomyrmex gracilis TaxID=219809 RepID=UPI000995D9E1|nr:angiogenic factor with G patch and FHA domains 1 isoform X2 [Pseudomyrmex gracilis]
MFYDIYNVCFLLLKGNKKKLINYERNSTNRTYIDYGTQTDTVNHDQTSHDWNMSDDKSSSIADQVKEVAESALLQTGFVYEATSGMYYDYNTGYYYDTKQGLYYDGNTGTYYYYDKTSNTYQPHSQVQTCTEDGAQVSQKKEDQQIQTNKDDVKKRKLANEDENFGGDEPEEGECSNSESDDITTNIHDISTDSESDHENEQDLAKSYPPCMRIIVKETDMAQLKVGSLFLVTCTGGSLGREGDHSVLIPDINISKFHARFIYDENKKQYQVVDTGSRNGTILNGKRLSIAKQESEPYDITHGSIIKISGTKLLCHIHKGNETCGHCEPGLVQQTINLEENTTSKRELHKEELRRLKHKFGIEKDSVTSNSQLASGYQDRAQARRQNVGSSHHRAKTEQSSVDTAISKANKGFQLLSKMGWAEGSSLGKDGDGMLEPLPITSNHSKSGLGNEFEADLSNITVDPRLEKKQAMWQKARKRYKAIAD